MLSNMRTRTLIAPTTSYWNPMQWIQEKFAPAPKKASERAVRHQDEPGATPAQDQVFHGATTSDAREMESTLKKKQEKQVLKWPKQPAQEVHLSFTPERRLLI